MHAGGVADGRLRWNGFGHCLTFSERWFVDPSCHPRAGWENSCRPPSFCVHLRTCATPRFVERPLPNNHQPEWTLSFDDASPLSWSRFYDRFRNRPFPLDTRATLFFQSPYVCLRLTPSAAIFVQCVLRFLDDNADTESLQVNRKWWIAVVKVEWAVNLRHFFVETTDF